MKSLGAFSEANCIPPFPEGGLSTETVASQVSPWLFVPFSSLTSLGKIGLGNCYINAVWSWYERKLLLGNSSVLSAKARLVALGLPSEVPEAQMDCREGRNLRRCGAG